MTLSILLINMLSAKEVPMGIFGNESGIETPFLVEEVIASEDGIELQVEQWCEVNNDCGHDGYDENRIARIKFMMYNISPTLDPDHYIWRLVWKFKTHNNEVADWKAGDRVKMQFDFTNMTVVDNTLEHDHSGVQVQVEPESISIIPEKECAGGVRYEFKEGVL